jgi:hypothetical protein
MQKQPAPINPPVLSPAELEQVTGGHAYHNARVAKKPRRGAGGGRGTRW